MNLPDDKSAGSPGAPLGSADSDSRGTGLPVLRTWRAVYALVLAVFVLWVVLLTLLSRMFS